jgi:sulfite exporter TauE/SafE
MARAAGPRKNTALLTFQLGRIIGYSILGGLAAASMEGLGWLTVQSAAIRPVWTLFHIATAVLGLVLLWQARQPVWLEAVGRSVWARAKSLGLGAGGAPLLMGTLWALLPCGLLYSAVLVAAMAGGVLQGAAVMALFALGTSVTMTLGPWLWLRLRGSAAARGQMANAGAASGGDWGIRLAGAALTASAAWALWMGLVHNTAPWCVTP